MEWMQDDGGDSQEDGVDPLLSLARHADSQSTPCGAPFTRKVKCSYL